MQINEDTAVPEWLFVMFSVCTTILVAVHIFALMISTYILPNIDAISKLDVCELVSESPHERMKGFIELAWAFSTVLGKVYHMGCCILQFSLKNKTRELSHQYVLVHAPLRLMEFRKTPRRHFATAHASRRRLRRPDRQECEVMYHVQLTHP